MTLHPIVASRRSARIVGALTAPLLAIIAGSLPNIASAGSAIVSDPQPAMHGSYCGGSSEDAQAPVRAGCARISGYITAGAHFGSNEQIGGRRDPFGLVNQSSGLTIVGAPLGSDRFLAPANSADIAR